MTKYNVIVEGVIIDTIEVENINTLDGYELPQTECHLEKID